MSICTLRTRRKGFPSQWANECLVSMWWLTVLFWKYIKFKKKEETREASLFLLQCPKEQ